MHRAAGGKLRRGGGFEAHLADTGFEYGASRAA